MRRWFNPSSREGRAPFGLDLTWISGALLSVAILSCGPEARSTMPPNYVEPPLRPGQEQQLLALRAQARGSPHDFEAHKSMGLFAMWLTLSGHLSLLDTAEHHLERAFLLNPHDKILNRSLGRFYNLRAVAGDDSKGAWQVRVYQAHLGDQDPLLMEPREFVAWSFSQLGRALDLRHRGRLLAALGVVRSLERTLDEWVDRHPDDIEAKALAGNFALFFAGNLPVGKKRRVRKGVALFDAVHARWDEMPMHAKDPHRCPNTYDNFMFELAEGHLVLGEVDQAEALYRELIKRGDLEPAENSSARPNVSRPQSMIAAVSRERLSHLSQYVGDLRLMPPWPSDVGNCIVCHTRTADIPLDSLWSRSPSAAFIPAFDE